MDCQKNLSTFICYRQAKHCVQSYQNMTGYGHLYYRQILLDAVLQMRKLQATCAHELVVLEKNHEQKCLICEKNVEEKRKQVLDLSDLSHEELSVAWHELALYLPVVLEAQQDEEIILAILREYVKQIFWNRERKLNI